eukprot:2557800-Heterocapsa_arctica.AAC.1
MDLIVYLSVTQDEFVEQFPIDGLVSIANDGGNGHGVINDSQLLKRKCSPSVLKRCLGKVGTSALQIKGDALQLLSIL